MQYGPGGEILSTPASAGVLGPGEGSLPPSSWGCNVNHAHCHPPVNALVMFAHRTYSSNVDSDPHELRKASWIWIQEANNCKKLLLKIVKIEHWLQNNAIGYNKNLRETFLNYFFWVEFCCTRFFLSLFAIPETDPQLKWPRGAWIRILMKSKVDPGFWSR